MSIWIDDVSPDITIHEDGPDIVVEVVEGVIYEGGQGSGTTDHRELSNRDAANQHPIESITGLSETLNNKIDSELLSSVSISGDYNDLLNAPKQTVIRVAIYADVPVEFQGAAFEGDTLTVPFLSGLIPTGELILLSNQTNPINNSSWLCVSGSGATFVKANPILKPENIGMLIVAAADATNNWETSTLRITNTLEFERLSKQFIRGDNITYGLIDPSVLGSGFDRAGDKVLLDNETWGWRFTASMGMASVNEYQSGTGMYGHVSSAKISSTLGNSAEGVIVVQTEITTPIKCDRVGVYCATPTDLTGSEIEFGVAESDSSGNPIVESLVSWGTSPIDGVSGFREKVINHTFRPGLYWLAMGVKTPVLSPSGVNPLFYGCNSLVSQQVQMTTNNTATYTILKGKNATQSITSSTYMVKAYIGIPVLPKLGIRIQEYL